MNVQEKVRVALTELVNAESRLAVATTVLEESRKAHDAATKEVVRVLKCSAPKKAVHFAGRRFSVAEVASCPDNPECSKASTLKIEPSDDIFLPDSPCQNSAPTKPTA